MSLLGIIFFWSSLGGLSWLFNINNHTDFINQINDLNLQLIDVTGNYELMYNELSNELSNKNQQYSFLEQRYNILEKMLDSTNARLNAANTTINELKQDGEIIYIEGSSSVSVSEDADAVEDALDGFNNNN